MSWSLSTVFRNFGNRKRKAIPLNSPTTVLGKVKTLARANLNDLFSEAKDPEALANSMLNDYAAALQEARRAVSGVITSLRTAEARQSEDEAEIGTWRDRAELAVARAKKLRTKDPEGAAKAEKMALTALKKERSLEIRVDQRRPSLEDQQELVEGLTIGIEQLEERYSTLQDQRDVLVSRARFAAAQDMVATATRETDSENTTSTLHALERSVREREALAQGKMELANSSVEAQFRQLEEEASGVSAEQELEVIMGRSTQAIGTGRTNR